MNEVFEFSIANDVMRALKLFDYAVVFPSLASPFGQA